MSNTLTSLIPDLYEALDTVSRELVGLIPAVTRDHGLARAAVGQTVRSFVAPASTASDIVPAVIPPNDGDQNIGNVAMTITKSRRVPIRWNGEEELGINSGPGVGSIRINQMAQAMRTLTNEIESSLAAQYIQASRAWGTPGSAPFASSLGDPAQIRKILSDNGAPLTDLQMVINSTAGANLRTLAQLTKVNEVGSTDTLRQGTLLDIHGFAIRESAQIKSPTKGTGASYVTSGALAVGAVSIPLVTGTGTINAGDVITFAGDANKYVVAAGISAPGTVTLALPGLMTAVNTGTAVTVGASAAMNMAFARSSIALATRLPALPSSGDAAVDRTTITDPISGLSFEVAMYAQYRQMQYEISCCWGSQVFKAEHLALLLG